MSDSRPAPYPADTRAKGWRFELDHERIRQSDTWALTPADVRPWLLMLWMTAWEQTPCGSLPNDDALIAARIGMAPKQFAKAREFLMRGWARADDGRLYHDVMTERVIEMMERRRSESDRKARQRARNHAGPDATPPDVPPVSRGTGAGLTQDSTRSPTPEPEPEPEPVVVENTPGSFAREAEAGQAPTAAGLVTQALRRAGIARACPSNQRLLMLLEAGATVEEFLAFVPKALEMGDPFTYTLGAVEGERKRAAEMAGHLHRGPMPQQARAPTATERQMAAIAGRSAAPHLRQPQPAAPLAEVIDVTPRILGR